MVVARFRGTAVEGNGLGIYHGSKVSKTWSCMTCTIPEVQQSSFVLYHLRPLQSKLVALLLRWSTGFLSHTDNCFSKWLSSYILLSRACLLFFFFFFCNMDRLITFQISSSSFSTSSTFFFPLVLCNY